MLVENVKEYMKIKQTYGDKKTEETIADYLRKRVENAKNSQRSA